MPRGEAQCAVRPSRSPWRPRPSSPPPSPPAAGLGDQRAGHDARPVELAADHHQRHHTSWSTARRASTRAASARRRGRRTAAGSPTSTTRATSSPSARAARTPTVVAPAKAGATRSHPDLGRRRPGDRLLRDRQRRLEAAGGPGLHRAGQPGRRRRPAERRWPRSSPRAPTPRRTPTAGRWPSSTTTRRASKDEIWVQDGFGRGSAGPILADRRRRLADRLARRQDHRLPAHGRSGHEQIWTVALERPGRADPGRPGRSSSPPTPTTTLPDLLARTAPGSPTRAARPRSGAADSVNSIAADGSGAASGVGPLRAPRPTSRSTPTPWPGCPAPTGSARRSPPPRPSGRTARPTRWCSAAPTSSPTRSAAARWPSRKGGPLLLTPIDHLDAAVKAEITRVLGKAVPSKTVYVLGGEQALSPAVYNRCKALGYTVKRISGADRYATSIAIAQEVQGNDAPSGWSQPERVLVATGNLAPDALSAGAAAEASGGNGPSIGIVLLTNDKVMPPAVEGLPGPGQGAQHRAVPDPGLRHRRPGGHRADQHRLPAHPRGRLRPVRDLVPGGEDLLRRLGPGPAPRPPASASPPA